MSKFVFTVETIGGYRTSHVYNVSVKKKKDRILLKENLINCMNTIKDGRNLYLENPQVIYSGKYVVSIEYGGITVEEVQQVQKELGKRIGFHSDQS